MRRILFFSLILFVWQVSFGQLSGTKTIPGDYATIEAAITALNTQGVGSGGVTFNIAAGHTETFTTPTAGQITATGTSANPVVFQKSGAGANPLITAATPGTGTMDYIICFNGADYITFDGINVQENPANASATDQMEWAFALLKTSETNGAQNNVIRNCAITLNPANTNGRAIYSNNHTTASTTQLVISDVAGANSYNKFYNLTVSNTYHAFYLYGRADVNYYDIGNELGVDGPNTINGLGNTGGTVASYGIYSYYQTGLKIANNTFTGTSGNTTGAQYVMYLMTSTNASADVYNNTVSMTYTGTGSFYGIYSSGLGSSGTDNTINYYNNQVVNNSIPNHTSGTIYFIYISTGGVTANFYNNNVSNNQVGSPTSTSTGSIYYTYFASSPTNAGVTNVYNNMVTNNTRTQSTVGGGATYVFYTSGSSGGATGVANIYDNTVNSVTIGASGTTYIFYNLVTAGTKNFYDNTAYNVVNANGTVYGLYNGNGTTGYFYNNKLSRIQMASVSGTLYGIYQSSGTNMYYYNNYISELTAPQASGATAIHGIYISGGTSHGFYNNTVYLNASSSDPAFGSTAIYTSTTPIVELRNNILVNVSNPGASGTTIVYRRSSTSLGTYATTSNNNDFFAGTPGPSRVIFYDGTNTDQTLGDYQARVSPADASSITENPPFVNVTTPPYNLHMQTTVPTQLESGGATVSTPVDITTDYDGDPRYPNTGYPDNASSPATAPDIGADEFGGLGTDLTPPNIAFTPFQSTASTTARTLMTTITDASGVPTTGIGMPVLYWRINTGAWNNVQAVWLGGDDFSFTFGAGAVLGDVVSYYVVAQDLATPTPNIGANPSGGAAGFTTNPPACSTPPDSPYQYSILGSICGTFQVGVGQDYNTITEAIADLAANEVTCPIIFELTDATYAGETLPILLIPAAGASAVNTITIKPAAGVSPTITGSSTAAIFKFEGGQYYIIDGSNLPGGTTRNLTIENSATSTNSSVIWLSSQGSGQGSPNNVIKNCKVMAGSNTVTSTFGIYLGGATITTTGTGADNDNVIIENNQVARSFYGIYAQGVPTTGELDGLVIRNNTVGSDVASEYITGYGMRLQSINGGQIVGNEVYNMIYDGSKYGIWMGTYISNSLFSRNHIHAMGQTNTTATYYCIAMYFSSTTGALNNEISNNIIYDLDQYGSTSNFYGPIGIRIIGGNGYKVWHNTISITGAFGSTTAGVFSHCLFISTATNNMDLRDNIFFNTRTGNAPKAYTVYTPSTSTFTVINYNDYFSTGSAIGYFGTEIATFADWQVATGGDQQSKNVDPLFVSPTNLTPTNAALNNQGIYLASVPKDYNMVNRTNPPDIGAIEFGANPAVVTVAATGVSATTATLNGTVNAIGQTVFTYFDYGTSTNYEFTTPGIPGTITGTTTTPYSFALTGLTTSVVYHYRARGVTATGLTIFGDNKTFETVPPATATTTAATGITLNGATLNGVVNANNSTAAVTFEYGPTDSYGFVVTAVPSPVTGNTDVPVSADISGLGINSTYHFRVVATNSAGPAYGADMMFTTLSAPPVVVTNPATNVLITTAQLNGTVTANNQTTNVTFEWGQTMAYGNVVSAIPATVDGSNPTAVMAEISGLLDNTTYHFRCVGTNATGTTYGANQTFNTYCPPPGPAGPITGPASVCKPSGGHVYSVAPIVDATDYTWTVPAGATITAGLNTNTITVSYDETAVSGNVTVYGSSNCGTGAPSSLAVSVNPLPVPTITGDDASCLGASEIYTTEAGMSNYQWAVSAGGQITAGAGTHSVTVQWNGAGAQFVSVTYTSAAGCPAAAPTTLNVSVGTLPTPTITGSATMCVNSGFHVYTTEMGYSGYIWTASAGGVIVSGQGTYQVEIDWTIPGSQTVTVNYQTANGCSAAQPASMTVTVLGAPAAAGDITGAEELCEGTLQVAYSVAAIAGATSYAWSIPVGAFISAGAGTNSILVDFPEGASSGAITVHGVNTCGNGPTSDPLMVMVYPIPATPVVTVNDDYLLTSSAPEGNQWYFNGVAIEGANGQTFQAEEEGTYWTVVTLNGCESDESNQVEVIFVGLGELSGASVTIYPVPNNGVFNINISNLSKESYTLTIFNNLGVKVYESTELTVNGRSLKKVDLGSSANGLYTLVIQSGDAKLTRRVLITN